jgi:hypothetical protein
MLYIGTFEPLPLVSTQDLRIESVDARRGNVAQWFANAEVRFVGAHTGCSCGFPSVIAESPVEYYDGMRLESDNRAADVRSVRALLELLRRLSRSQDIELYPIADGDESKPPKGVIEWHMGALDAERLFFNEGFMHVVRRDVNQ